MDDYTRLQDPPPSSGQNHGNGPAGRRPIFHAGFASILLAFILFLSLAGTCWPAQEEKQLTVTVIGSSPVISDKLPEARRRAVADGLEEAVNRALAKLLPPETIVDKFQLIGQALLSKTESFIPGYKVLAEAVHDKHYRVAVQATISMERLKAQLAAIGLMLGSAPYPRVLVLISERRVNEEQFRPWWPGSPDRSVVSGRILADRLAANRNLRS